MKKNIIIANYSKENIDINIDLLQEAIDKNIDILSIEFHHGNLQLLGNPGKNYAEGYKGIKHTARKISSFKARKIFSNFTLLKKAMKGE